MPLSAGDWTRIKRIRSARDYETGPLTTNKDITNVAMRSDRSVVGSSRIRREASKWTDYVASRAQGDVLKSEVFNATTNWTTGVSQNTLVKINCNCGTLTGANSAVLPAKLTGCVKCQH